MSSELDRHLDVDGRTIRRKDLYEYLALKGSDHRDYVVSRLNAAQLDPAIADDILQEVWIAVFRDVESFRPQGQESFDHWVKSILECRVVNALRAQRAVKRGGQKVTVRQVDRLRSSYLSLLEELINPNQPTPSSEYATREAVDHMQLALATLPDRHRRAIFLHHLQCRPLSEVASLMNVTQATLDGLLYRGRRLLRQRLGRAARFYSDA